PCRSAPCLPLSPFSFGQSGTVQRLSRMRSNQTRCGSDENFVLRPPQNTSASEAAGLRISGGQFASSQARVSLRNCSRSDIGVSIQIKGLESTLVTAWRNSISDRIRHSFRAVATAREWVYALSAITIEKQQETVMRLKLVGRGEMSGEQKETYDESIAGKRGAPPAPMMAWLNSPEMARHATRLGEVMRFNTIFPAKLSEIAILVTARHFTAHYEWFAHKRLALKGGMDPKIIEDIRDRRTPSFDDP